jgi:multimeric flavodoxin WrbA
MKTILAVYGSPRRNGNTAHLLQEAVRGARQSGAQVTEIVLRDLSLSPCLEIYGCKQTGRCVIQDDFQNIFDQILSCNGLMLATPVFFYTVSAHTKILMDRCQSLWVKRYWLEQTPFSQKPDENRKGLFISAGATKGKKLFDGITLTTRYFFDAINMRLWRSLLYRNLDFEGDVLNHPAYLLEAYHAGAELVEELEEAT